MSSIITPPKKFVSLHSHDGFSTFDGLGYPQEHIDFVIENGMDSWCLTNHGHMNSFAHAFLHAEKINKRGGNFKFVPGCEMYVHPDLDIWNLDYELAKAAKKGDKESISKLREQRERIRTPLFAKVDGDDETVELSTDQGNLTIENEEESKSAKFYDPVKRRHHLVVLPKTSIGLQRLFQLVSRGYLEGFYRFPRVDYKMLREAAEGGHLMISSACLGGPLSYEVFKHLQEVEFDNLSYKLLNDPSIMKKVQEGISNSFDAMAYAVGTKNVKLELQFNKLPAQHLVNRAIMKFADDHNLREQLVVTCDSHYAHPEHWREREIYKKLGWLNFKDFDPDSLPKSREELSCELYPKNSEQVWDSFEKTTEGMDFYDPQIISDAINRTYDIVHEEIGEINPDREMKLPSYVIPKGKTASRALLDFCKKGMIERNLHEDSEYIERLKAEFTVIKDKNFAEYFLTMKAILDIAREKMLIGPGRGSGAGSLVNYVLGITDVDPVKNGLLFERFLSPERNEMPDIDSDVSDRDELITLLRDNFGESNVVPISNYNTFKLKSLVKDVSRFYRVPFEEANKALAPLEVDVKRGRKNDAESDDSFDIKIGEAIKYSESLRNYLKKYPEIFEPLKVLFKQNKALGRHAGGVIISERIAERMPIILARGEPQTPWVEGMNYKHLEEFGWIKFDLLGLETLRIIEKTINLILTKQGAENPSFSQIKEWFDRNMSTNTIDFNDQKVYKNVYHAGKWAAIFQCTQRGAQALFKRAKPESIVDIATLTSIYRPGPLSAKVDKLYIGAKKNPESVVYGHPLIKECLEETYGCIIFQEQVMNLCHVVAGIPKDECNAMRKMMKPVGSGNENIDKARALKEKFISGSIANGVEKHVAEDLYEKILYFAGYGFNKSHAVSYAINSYYCAWLMTYYEQEWITAYLEAVSSNPNKLSKALSEVKKMGYTTTKVDINKAGKNWTAVSEKVLMPSFFSCKGIGEAAIEEILSNRPYTSIDNLLWHEDGKWKHSKLNKKTLESLLKIRALDSLDWQNYFQSYKQFFDCVSENWPALRKSTKKNPYQGKDNLLELILDYPEDDWNIKENMEFEESLLGTININNLIPAKLSERFEKLEIQPMEEWNSKNLYWFVAVKVNKKKTKNGKPYFLLDALGSNGEKNRMFCWGTKEDSVLNPYSLCVAELDKSDFGFSTTFRKVKVFEV